MRITARWVHKESILGEVYLCWDLEDVLGLNKRKVRERRVAGLPSRVSRTEPEAGTVVWVTTEGVLSEEIHEREGGSKGMGEKLDRRYFRRSGASAWPTVWSRERSSSQKGFPHYGMRCQSFTPHISQPPASGQGSGWCKWCNLLGVAGQVALVHIGQVSGMAQLQAINSQSWVQLREGCSGLVKGSGHQQNVLCWGN